MITDLVLSLILFGLSIACFVGVVGYFIQSFKDAEYPIAFVVSILISLLFTALCYLTLKYGNIKCSASAAILCFGFAIASLFSVLVVCLSSENAVCFIVLTIMSFLFLLGGIKFFPDIRFENPDCDFQQTRQTNKTVENKSSEETSKPVEQSEQVKQSSNKDILILDKENKNIYKLDENTSKQIIDLLNKQEQ